MLNSISEQSNPVTAGKTAAVPVATVLMLAYNHGPYIRESIESIINQKTSFPFELVIGEDCSKDDTRKIALEYEQSHPEIVRVIYSEKNVGGHENGRRIEAACRGDYVCYCEGDDYWHVPTKLQTQVDFLKANPGYVMVHSDCRWFFVETGRLEPNAVPQAANLNDADAYLELLSCRRNIWTVTACIRRATLDAVLRECPECYDVHFPMGDTQRWLELARRGKVKCIHEALATRRALPESASRSKDRSRVLRFALSAKEILYHYLAKYDCPETVAREVKAHATLMVLANAFQAGDHTVARVQFEEYRQLGVPIQPEGYLYYRGSRSPLLKELTRPALLTLRAWQKGTNRLSRLMKSA
jgi:glycosyltransferase involved in cell wall biosynthesis